MIVYGVNINAGGRRLINDKMGQLVEQLATHAESIAYVVADAPDNDNELAFYQESYTYAVQAENVSIHGVPTSSPNDGPVAKSLVWLKRSIPYLKHIRNADFVYITMPGFSGFLATLLCRLVGRPYCLYFGSDWQEVALYLSKWNTVTKPLFWLYVKLSRWAERTAVRHARFALVHGRKLEEKFADLGVPVVGTVPMVSIRKEHFYQRTDTCQSQQVTCLYVGALIPRKNVHSLIQALHYLVEGGQPARLVIVGAGEQEYTTRLHKLARQFGLEAHVQFCGQVSDLSELLELYRSADVFVLPSHGEGFPRVIYEAMSQSVPVVTSGIATIKMVLQDKCLAELVEPPEPLNLAQAIEKIVEDGNLRRKLIENGYNFAMSRIGMEITTSEQLLKLISKHGG